MGSPVWGRITEGSSWLVSMISRLRSCQGRWSAWPTTRGRSSWWRTPPPCEEQLSETSQMNELCEKFSDKLAVLAFPTNQFGHQENAQGQEILNALKHVRPGNGFEFKGEMFDKVEANGENEHPMFKF